MALLKFPKAKTFHVDYCGCTAASHLLDETSVRQAINLIRQVKSKREFVKTTLSVSKDGVNIIYDNDQKFTTRVPATMIAGSNIGKSSLHDTIGVVYISPLTGRHYPAFVHVYRCDSARTAQKLLARLRAYLLIESHRLKIAQLEQKLMEENILDLNQYKQAKAESQSPDTTLNSVKTNTAVSSSSTSSGSRLDKLEAVKSITDEFQKKIESQQPILFPPKDYDDEHEGHGNIRQAQAFKSTQSSIVGYTSTDKPASALYQSSENVSKVDHYKRAGATHQTTEDNHKPGYLTQRSDITADPLETVSLAFDFLKDETGSIVADSVDNVEPIDSEGEDGADAPVLRFRPPTVIAPIKKPVTQNYNREMPHSYHQSHLSSRNDLNEYYDSTHYRRQQISNGNRTHSDTNLHHDSQSGFYRSSRADNRLFIGAGAPISTNPLWTPTTTAILGSQPNLLAPQSSVLQMNHRSHLSPQFDRRLTSVPLQHPNYINRSSKSIISSQKENMQKRPGPPPPPPPPLPSSSFPLSSSNFQKKQSTSQYLGTDEFILRPSDGQLVNNSHYHKRLIPNVSRDYRPHSIDVNGNSHSMLDVYY